MGSVCLARELGGFRFFLSPEDEGGKFLRKRSAPLRSRDAAALRGLRAPRARVLRSGPPAVRELQVADPEPDFGLFVPKRQPARPRNYGGGRTRHCGAVGRDDGAVARVAGQEVAGAGGPVPAEGRSGRATQSWAGERAPRIAGDAFGDLAQGCEGSARRPGTAFA